MSKGTQECLSIISSTYNLIIWSTNNVTVEVTIDLI